MPAISDAAPPPLSLVTGIGKTRDLTLMFIHFLSGKEACYSENTAAVRRAFNGYRLEQVYLVATSSTCDVLDEIVRDASAFFPNVVIKKVPLQVDDIGTASEERQARDTIYTLMEEIGGSDLVIGSGGRQALTFRLLEAGHVFGFRGYLSIIATGEVNWQDFSRQEVIYMPVTHFLSERWRWQKGLHAGEAETRLGSSFRSVSVFPAGIQRTLSDLKIGERPCNRSADLSWLRSLPKADLHCHLGGCQSPAILKELSTMLLEELGISAVTREKLLRLFEKRLGISDITMISSALLRSLAVHFKEEASAEKNKVHCLQYLYRLYEQTGQPAHVCTAVLVSALPPEVLLELSRDGRLKADGSVDWPARSENSLSWYMACGDIGGSSLLQSEATLRWALRRLLEDAVAENIRYLEVRFSPDNYTRSGRLDVNGAVKVLLDEGRCFMDEHQNFTVNFLIMATRHKSRMAMATHVAAAVTHFSSTLDQGARIPRVAGFDLAGQEKDYDPVNFREDFLPLHRAFVNITIHAGEMADDDSIWQAMYLLHAKRIGHGLKLINNSRMMDFVRDHALCVEMCPSSNWQTNSFRCFDSGDPQRSSEEVYPLHRYLAHGISVTVNTDNRFISDTTLSEEFLMAARMTEGGLSRGDVLRLIRNSFQAAFLPRDAKDRLLKEIDDNVFTILRNDFFQA